MHAGKEGTAAPFPPFAISFQVQGRRTHSRGRGQFSPLPPLAGAHLCCIATKPKKKIEHFSLYVVETGVRRKSSPHKAWCNTVIVLPAFSLLRHRGATARRPESKFLLWPNPKLE